MTIKILIFRKMSEEQEFASHKLMLKLNALAKQQPGYISGESFAGFNDPEDRMILCSWRSIDDWEAFNNLDESKELHYMIDQILVRPTEHKIYRGG